MRTVAFAGLALVAAIMASAPAGYASDTQTVLSTGKTIMGETVVYPDGPAKVTATIVTMAPGEVGGLHTHGIPLLGYVLDGVLTVDYGDKGKRVYRAGDAVMETISVPHRGINTGNTPMRVLVVYMGADGKTLSTSVPANGKK